MALVSGSENEKRDLGIAQELQYATGYKLVEKKQNPSGGGFKDWYISAFRKPSYTIEIGRTINGRPLKYTEYNKIWRDNKYVPILAALLVHQDTH